MVLFLFKTKPLGDLNVCQESGQTGSSVGLGCQQPNYLQLAQITSIKAKTSSA